MRGDEVRYSAAPDGDQVDLIEVIEIADGLIQHHRIYWDWFRHRAIDAQCGEEGDREDIGTNAPVI
jgi:hypothetical protein